MSHSHSAESSGEPVFSRTEQKHLAIETLEIDHTTALAEYEVTRAAREERRTKAFGIHVTCMDERDTFAAEATGEPLGALELFATPGGRTTPEELLRAYGPQLKEAREAGKELRVWLMPHHCTADSHAGCAAFAMDEAAQTAYFTKLADDLRSCSEFEGVQVLTAFYDTDMHGLTPFHGTEIPKDVMYAGNHLRETVGISREGGLGADDRSHAGTRVYIGDRPRAWVARRNAAYHLSPEMDREELFEGAALAVMVMKTHSHTDMIRVPVVIQIDRRLGMEDIVGMSDVELLKRFNASPILRGIELTSDEFFVVRTETDPASWEGDRLLDDNENVT